MRSRNEGRSESLTCISTGQHPQDRDDNQDDECDSESPDDRFTIIELSRRIALSVLTLNPGRLPCSQYEPNDYCQDNEYQDCPSDVASISGMMFDMFDMFMRFNMATMGVLSVAICLGSTFNLRGMAISLSLLRQATQGNLRRHLRYLNVLVCPQIFFAKFIF